MFCTKKCTFDFSAIDEFLRVPSENELTLEMAHFVSTSPQQFAVHFATKSWLLLAAKTNTPFIIGDNPVVMQNLPDADGLRGTLGLAVQGIETPGVQLRSARLGPANDPDGPLQCPAIDRGF